MNKDDIARISEFLLSS